jgi:hypothetical protein
MDVDTRSNMVRVEIWTAQEDPSGQLVATVVAEAKTRPQVSGPRASVVRMDEAIFSVTTGEAVCWEDDPEEWARSLPASYRGPGLLAQLTYDDAQGGVLPGEGSVERPLLIRQRVRD